LQLAKLKYGKIPVDIKNAVCYKDKARLALLVYCNGAPEKCQNIYIYITEETKMSTTMANQATVERKWYVLDAAGKPMGKTAALAADLLRGKLKPTYTPNVDCGDFVIIINAEQAVLTGKKLDQKFYRHHSGWIGGLKEVKYKDLMAKRPEFAMELAVKGMLQKNRIAADQLTRLKVYRGAEHKHAAQKPEVWDR